MQTLHIVSVSTALLQLFSRPHSSTSNNVLAAFAFFIFNNNRPKRLMESCDSCQFQGLELWNTGIGPNFFNVNFQLFSVSRCGVYTSLNFLQHFHAQDGISIYKLGHLFEQMPGVNIML